ncbi:hypothetical protein F5Y14DRAFT_259410 [Nemania sp. NC0429]|nr:hypothetical protein F5Y14DRAFT_259410 [Nemania sp. NC0429]
MTKPWDLHEATIKKLYAENTLAVVRKTMSEEYNFKASTRAYRGRLVKWGVRKYHCRRQSDCSSMLSAGSPGGSASESDAASPILSQATARSDHDLSRYSDGRRVRDHNEPTMSNLLGRPYNTLETGSGRSYNTENYYQDRAIAPPVEKMHYGWNMTPSQPTSPTTFGHADVVGTAGPLYGYAPLPPAPSPYPTTIYEPRDAGCDRRYIPPPMPGQSYDAIHDESNYPSMRGYGHGHPNPEIESLYHVRKDC